MPNGPAQGLGPKESSGLHSRMTKIFIDGGRIFKVLFDVEKIMKKIMQFMTRMTFHMQFFMKKIMQFLNKKI